MCRENIGCVRSSFFFVFINLFWDFSNGIYHLFPLNGIFTNLILFLVRYIPSTITNQIKQDFRSYQTLVREIKADSIYVIYCLFSLSFSY